jgi:hypothetical protein
MEEEESTLKMFYMEFPARVVVALWADSEEEALSEAGFEMREVEGLTTYQTQGGNELYVYIDPYAEGKVTEAINPENA